MVSALFTSTLQAQNPPPDPKQEVCYTLTVDTFMFISTAPPRFIFRIKNDSTFTARNLWMFSSNIPNRYMKYDSAARSPFLDTVGGVNNGITQFVLAIDSLAPADSVPLNTLHTIYVTLADSAHTFHCFYDASFIYGKGFPLSITGPDNASSRQIRCSIQGEMLELSGAAQDSQIGLYSVDGRMWLSEKLPDDRPHRNIRVGALPPGIYFLTVQDKQARSTAKLLIR